MTDSHLLFGRVEERKAALRDHAKGLLGISGDQIGLPSLRDAVSGDGIGWYPLIALALVFALDQASGFIVNAVGPDVTNALGIAPSTFANIVAQRQTFVGLLALQFAFAFYRHPHRRALAIKQFGIQYGPALIVASAVTWAPAMLPILGPIGAGGALVYSGHRPLIMDAYPPEARVRMLSIHQSGGVLGLMLAPGLVAGLTGWLGFTWRGAFLFTGILFVLLGAVALRLRDPGYGRFDTDRVRRLVDSATPVSPSEAGVPSELVTKPDFSDQSVDQRFTEMVQRLWQLPSVPRLLAAWAVLGAAVGPLTTYQMFFLQDRFGLALGARSAFYVATSTFALPALWWFGRRGDAAYRADPSRLIRLISSALAILSLGFILAVTPLIGLSLVGFGLVFATSSIAAAGLSAALLSLVPPRARPLAGAMSAFFFAIVGGGAGALVMGGIDRRSSVGLAILLLALPATLAALLLRRTSRTVSADVVRLIDEVIEDEEFRIITSAGLDIPLLTCTRVNFAYGAIQVLFNVDFTIDTGETVALLGTNGAGKSTLLRCICGVGLPSSGTIRFGPADITYLDAERRVRLGITQVPGGRAVFGPMTVIENLRLYAYTIGGGRRTTDAAINQCFDAFPQLAERRNQNAAVLSGGEQQMLGLSKALILRPRLLLIDELSLGLAPIVVAQLMDMVRRINSDGSAVLLVEQSVNIALNIVDHVYFMEKGEIHFDGRSQDLLARTDLLRAVFLQGTGQARSAPLVAGDLRPGRPGRS